MGAVLHARAARAPRALASAGYFSRGAVFLAAGLDQSVSARVALETLPFALVSILVYEPLTHLAQHSIGPRGGFSTLGFLTQMSGRGIAWCLSGMAMGLGQGIALRSGRLLLYGLLGGAIGGLLGGLMFDHFGDFEGFILETDEGERRYFSRETEIRTLAERVWSERLRITVMAECESPACPRKIIVRQPPAQFKY